MKPAAALPSLCPGGSVALRQSLSNPFWNVSKPKAHVRPSTLTTTWQDRLDYLGNASNTCISAVRRGVAWQRPQWLQPFKVSTLLRLLRRHGISKLIFIADSWLSKLVPVLVDRLVGEGLEVVHAQRSVLNGKYALRGGCRYSLRWVWTLASRRDCTDCTKGSGCKEPPLSSESNGKRRQFNVELLGLHCTVPKKLSKGVSSYLQDAVCGSSTRSTPVTVNSSLHSGRFNFVWEGQLVNDINGASGVCIWAHDHGFGSHWHVASVLGGCWLGRDGSPFWGTCRTFCRLVVPCCIDGWMQLCVCVHACVCMYMCACASSVQIHTRSATMHS